MDLTKILKIGDMVFSTKHGDLKVDQIHDPASYPYPCCIECVTTENSTLRYTVNGKSNCEDLYVELYPSREYFEKHSLDGLTAWSEYRKCNLTIDLTGIVRPGNLVFSPVYGVMKVTIVEKGSNIYCRYDQGILKYNNFGVYYKSIYGELYPSEDFYLKHTPSTRAAWEEHVNILFQDLKPK